LNEREIVHVIVRQNDRLDCIQALMYGRVEFHQRQLLSAQKKAAFVAKREKQFEHWPYIVVGTMARFAFEENRGSLSL